MATKRKQNSDQFSPNKKYKSPNNNGGAQSSQPPLDPTYGQRGAFPGLDNDDTAGDEGSEEDLDTGALRYLRSVRLQATSIPTLLVAPKSTAPLNNPPKDDADLYADYLPQGFYSDGAYTACPYPSTFPPSSSSHKIDDLDPQETYYTALLIRFRTFQSTFRDDAPLPPASSTSSRDSSVISALLRHKHSTWRGKLLKTTPTPCWLAALPHETIMFGLEVLGAVLTAGNLRHGKYGRNLGVWTWGLLGRCRNVGELGSEEVGVLRELGKQASWLGRRIVVGEVGEDVQERREEEEEEDEEVEADEGGEHDALKDVPQERAKDSPANTSEHSMETEQAEGGAEQTHHTAAGTTNHGGSNMAEPDIDRPGIGDVQGPEADENPEALRAAQARLLSSLNTNGATGAVGESVEQEGSLGESMPNTAEAMEPIGETPREDMLAMLDMIITIIGERYGQRDLLDTRLLWDEINS